MSKIFADPYRVLARLVGLNIAFDVLSIPFWIALPSLQTMQSTSTSTVNSTIAIVDAVFAAALFAVSFVGISKRRKWGSYLAIAVTLVQRVVGFFMFAPNFGMAVEVVWSILIILFAFRAMLQRQTSDLNKST